MLVKIKAENVEKDDHRCEVDFLEAAIDSQVEKEQTVWISFNGSERFVHLTQNLLKESPNLNSLRILHTKIPILRDNLFGPKFRQIMKLHLCHNGIKMIEDEAFVHMSNLEAISLSHNEIQSLSRKVFENNLKLVWISLKGNRIKMIATEAFQNSNKLKWIDLRGNQCVDQTVGCSGSDCDTKIDHALLDRELQSCYDYYTRSLEMLNEGEILDLFRS
jgi:hypothetical protein